MRRSHRGRLHPRLQSGSDQDRQQGPDCQRHRWQHRRQQGHRRRRRQQQRQQRQHMYPGMCQGSSQAAVLQGRGCVQQRLPLKGGWAGTGSLERAAELCSIGLPGPVPAPAHECLTTMLWAHIGRPAIHCSAPITRFAGHVEAAPLPSVLPTARQRCRARPRPNPRAAILAAGRAL